MKPCNIDAHGTFISSKDVTSAWTHSTTNILFCPVNILTGRSTGLLFNYILYERIIPTDVHILWYAHIDVMEYKMASIRMYERMGVQTDERATETIIFDQGVRKYVRFNYYDLWPGFTLLTITIIDHQLGSDSCELPSQIWLILLPYNWFSFFNTGSVRYFLT